MKWHGPYGLQPPMSQFFRDFVAAAAQPLDPGYVDDGRMVFYVTDPADGIPKPLGSFPVEDLGDGWHRRGSFVWADFGKLDLGIVRESTLAAARNPDPPFFTELGVEAALATTRRLDEMRFREWAAMPDFRWGDE